MRKGSVVYISNTDVQVVSAESKRNGLFIKNVFKFPLREGAMLNGVIIDEGALKKALTKVKEQGINEVHLVVDSAKILAKTATIPSMNKKQALQFVKDELSVIENNASTSMVYDYAYLDKDDKVAGASKILCVGVERKFIESYLDVFKEAGIEIKSIDYAVNSLISLVKKFTDFTNKTYVITQVDGQNTNSVLFINNEYVLTSRSRVFANKGTNEYNNEIGGLVSQLKQFASSTTHKTPISDIYFFGITEEESKGLFESVYTASNINAKRMPELKDIYYFNELRFDINDYLYCLGHFRRK